MHKEPKDAKLNRAVELIEQDELDGAQELLDEVDGDGGKSCMKDLERLAASLPGIQKQDVRSSVPDFEIAKRSSPVL